MKLRSTTPSLKQLASSSTLVGAAVLVVVATPLTMSTSVFADRFDDAIRAKEQEISQYQKEAGKLARQGDSLQNAVNALNAQKQAIQGQVDLSQAKFDKLSDEIKKTQEKIERNQDVLGSTLGSLYVEGSVTPLEMLASSDSVGDYVDKQQYRSAVTDQVGTSIKEITKLKNRLSKQKEEAKQILDDQKAQRDALAAKEAEKQKLLNDTRGQESSYRGLIEQRGRERQALEAEQQAAYAAARQSWGGNYVTVGGGGSYPWAGAPYPCWSYSCADPWGLYYRECVSYVAWKLDSQGYRVRHFGGAGNANEWPSTTSGYTSQRIGSPRAGDAAIDMSIGGVGHAMYVERVNGDGSIRISEYNFSAPGQYSVRDISSGQYSGWTFITFPR